MTPADAMATSVPAPIAIPTSAWANAGASFTPSPTMATLRPSACSWRTLADLSSGFTPAKTRSTPSSLPTAWETASASPVIMTTWMPRACKASTACRDSSRISSARPIAPMTAPSAMTCRMMAPSAFHSSLDPSALSPCSWRRFGPPTETSRPSTTAVTPTAVDARKSEAFVSSIPRDLAAATMARASGCSLSCSADAAADSTSSSVCPVTATMRERVG